jgi:hypothetical protein
VTIRYTPHTVLARSSGERASPKGRAHVQGAANCPSFRQPLALSPTLRAQLRGCANRGLISMNEFTQLIVSSHDAQSNLPQCPPRPSIATMIPQTGRLLPVSGSRLRECAVLIIRNPPAAAPNGLTASETLWYLRQAGFAVGGVRPVDVLRKALQQETVGVMKRPPTLCCQYRMYTYIPGSLSEQAGTFNLGPTRRTHTFPLTRSHSHGLMRNATAGAYRRPPCRST